MEAALARSRTRLPQLRPRARAAARRRIDVTIGNAGDTYDVTIGSAIEDAGAAAIDVTIGNAGDSYDVTIGSAIEDAGGGLERPTRGSAGARTHDVDGRAGTRGRSARIRTAPLGRDRHR